MILNHTSRILYKTRASYYLSPQETKIMLMLANNKLNTYDDARRFVYKQNITNATIKRRLTELKIKYHLRLNINNYGATLKDKVGIC